MVKNIFKKIIPKNLRLILISKINNISSEIFLSKLRIDIISYYDKQLPISPEEKEVLDYLKSNQISVFPYTFKNKYDKENIEVYLDKSNGLRYVFHEHKKLYFKRQHSIEYIKSLYHGLLLDQDQDSPHLYLTDDFNLTEFDVIADIGAAEGNFSLTNIERVKKIYLFEYDKEWIEALKATFKPWEHKVEICDKFVSDTNSEKTITIDKFTKINNDISFLKVDIEGEEENFLRGATNFLNIKQNLKMAICTYHKQEDEKKFTSILKDKNFEVNHSKRFMIFLHDKNIKSPFLRRGLLRVKKNSKY